MVDGGHLAPAPGFSPDGSAALIDDRLIDGRDTKP